MRAGLTESGAKSKSRSEIFRVWAKMSKLLVLGCWAGVGGSGWVGSLTLE